MHDPNAPTKQSRHDLVKGAIRLTRQEKFDEALPIFEEFLPQLTGGDLSDKRVAASAFSYYGLCVAMVRRKYSQAVDYCNVSLKSNFLDPDHRYNLALVYLERDDRRKAVETLNAGLRIEPQNTMINVILDRIGRRRPPAIAFLSRDNPINIFFGRMSATKKPGR